MADDALQIQDAASAALASVTRQPTTLDIKTALVALVRGDSVLRTLLGVSTIDPRIYPYYQPDAEINATTRRAYITYAQTAHPEHTRAVGEPVFTLAVWAYSWTVAEAVRDRLVALLDERAVTTAAGRQLWATRIAEHDNYQEDTKFSGKNLVFRFGFSRV